jgi:hypothetical protein
VVTEVEEAERPERPERTTGVTVSGITEWIDPNLVNQPRAPVFGTVTSDTQNIYVPWTYPPQINVGFMNQNLPFIESFRANLVTENGTTIVVGPGRPGPDGTGTGVKYVNNYYTGASDAVTGIVLTNNDKQIPGGSIPGINPYNGRNWYWYYDQNLVQNLTPNE